MSHFKWGNPLYSSPVVWDDYYIVIIFYIGSIFQLKLLKSRKNNYSKQFYEVYLREHKAQGESPPWAWLAWWYQGWVHRAHFKYVFCRQCWLISKSPPSFDLVLSIRTLYCHLCIAKNSLYKKFSSWFYAYLA